MMYKGREVPDSALIMGVKKLRTGKFVPFIKTDGNLILSGYARDTRAEAVEDIEHVIEFLGPARIYI